MLASCRHTPTAGDSAPATTNAPAQQIAAADQLFLLGPSDTIEVNVWRQADLSRSLLVDPSGYVSMPLAGQIKVSGLTINEVQGAIRSALEKYLVQPQVDVSLTSIRSARVQILGEVRSPGAFIVDRPMLPLDVVISAGGFTEDANQDAVLVARRGADGKVEVRSTSATLDGYKDGKMAYVRSGDVIYVPTLKIASVESFMVRLKNILSPVLSIEQGIVLYPDARDALKGEDRAIGGTEVTIPVQ